MRELEYCAFCNCWYFVEDLQSAAEHLHEEVADLELREYEQRN